ncbi:DUF7689 domain-containing protein [Candidatus Binatus sp.]|uniref:DUF7689 domain-containing protein n=1 Tax=Candidatus Binatus sp. TaxID=2811406 RepID=UPI003C73693D
MSSSAHKFREEDFPNLNNEFEKTSCDTIFYNCIAWTVGDTTKRWWPDPFAQLHWPDKIERIAKVKNFVEMYANHGGYTECDDGSLEPGIEKVAIYARGQMQAVKHAAWQLDDGTWSSKLGPLEDINHKTPENLTSKLYGEPVKFLKRERKSAKKPMP